MGRRRGLSRQGAAQGVAPARPRRHHRRRRRHWPPDVTSGRRLAPQEIEAAVDSVSVGDVMRVAKKYLWDKDIAVAAVGRVEGLQDYSRMRAEMSSLLW